MNEPSQSRPSLRDALGVRAMEEDWSGVVYDDDLDDDGNDDGGHGSDNYY